MAGDPFQHVRPGQKVKISAPAWNGAMNAARAHQQSTAAGASAGTPKQQFPQTGIVLVKNNSGGDLGMLSVLGIDGPLFDPTDSAAVNEFKSRVVLKGITPSATTHKGKFVILREPLKAGAIGEAYAAGCCPAKVNVVATGDTSADVSDGSSASLKSGGGSAKILWKESGTGVRWAVVLMPAGGGVDTQNLGTEVTAGATYINATTPQVFGFADGGDGGSHLGMATLTPADQYKSPQWNGSAWVMDWTRAHP